MSADLSYAPELLKDTNVGDNKQEVWRSFLHSLIQTPVNGVVQLGDAACGTNLLPSVQLIEAPVEASFGSPRWHAQVAGQTAGMLPWVLGLHVGSSAVLNWGAKRLTGVAAASVTRLESGLLHAPEKFLSMKTAVDVGASTVTGAVFGGLLTPSRPSDDLLSARSRNALSSALTFATLSTSMRGLASRGLDSPVLSGLISGVPAGFVSAHSHSLLKGEGLASANEVGKSVYGMTLVGSVFGAVEARRQARAETSEPVADAQKQHRDGRSNNHEPLPTPPAEVVQRVARTSRDSALPIEPTFTGPVKRIRPAESVLASQGIPPRRLSVLEPAADSVVARTAEPGRPAKSVEAPSISQPTVSDGSLPGGHGRDSLPVETRKLSADGRAAETPLLERPLPTRTGTVQEILTGLEREVARHEPNSPRHEAARRASKLVEDVMSQPDFPHTRWGYETLREICEHESSLGFAETGPDSIDNAYAFSDAREVIDGILRTDRADRVEPVRKDARLDSPVADSLFLLKNNTTGGKHEINGIEEATELVRKTEQDPLFDRSAGAYRLLAKKLEANARRIRQSDYDEELQFGCGHARVADAVEAFANRSR